MPLANSQLVRCASSAGATEQSFHAERGILHFGLRSSCINRAILPKLMTALGTRVVICHTPVSVGSGSICRSDVWIS